MKLPTLLEFCTLSADAIGSACSTRDGVWLWNSNLVSCHYSCIFDKTGAAQDMVAFGHVVLTDVVLV